ncbi:Abortive infection protein [Pirellula staleyi DSM 6068]|uniref:Abortive infection protein n=1 Tax=Pirellula staleyi (strain ATCC 27377 / DSM 6068 / ICPB 4128) TaxID=530564 RepID=D2QWM9_PIRSD|nr:CPBP family intramembrane glutamic endopeptidase [Pirellula staleyi]ADB17832.1 Abortive infection protein [Pirellula staleyi DSM 6068]
MLLVINFITLTLLGLSIGGWIVSFGKWRRGEAILPHTPRLPVPWGLLDLVACVLILIFFSALAIQSLISLGYLPPKVALESLDIRGQTAIIGSEGIAKLLTMVAIIGLICYRFRASAFDLGCDLKMLGHDVQLGTVAFAMIAPVIFTIQGVLVTFWKPSKHPLMETLRDLPNPTLFVVIAFSAVIVAPLVEEFFFRVLLQGWIERVVTYRREGGFELLFGGRPNAASPPLASSATETASLPGEAPTCAMPVLLKQESPPTEAPADAALLVDVSSTRAPRLRHSMIAIFTSSIIFALMHYSHGPDWVALTILALVLGFLYHRTHRITPSLVVHFLLNFLSLLALYSEVFLSPSTPQP